jgi:hypothetical protein
MRLLTGADELRPSNNAWDWLGPGIYFWEQNPHRALAYAEEAAKHQQKFNGRIKTPFVIGAVIRLGKCLNLIAPASISIVREAHFRLSHVTRNNSKKMPINKGANRQLDCAVINFVHDIVDEFGLPPYDTIRSPFHEGSPLYEGANFTDRVHIEIRVRNPRMIKGYFLPRPIAQFNPYLTAVQNKRGQ